MIRRVIILSAFDLWHEKLLTFCMLLALGAITSPVLILTGLKNGMIDAMQQRLISDPRNLEILPLVVPKPLDAAWFDELAAQAEVAFVTPRTGIARSSISLRKPGQSHDLSQMAEDIDAFPTASGDPLLGHHDVPVPGENEIVISHSIAQRLQAAVGDSLELVVRARNAQKINEGTLPLTVTSILPTTATSTDAVYLPTHLLDRVDDFRAGFAVPAYGWKGGDNLPPPMFQSAFVLSDTPLTPRLIAGLKVNTGFTDHHTLTRDLFEEQVGLRLRDEASITSFLRLDILRRPADSDNVAQLRRRASAAPGTNHLLPWNDPRPVEIILPDGSRKNVYLSGVSREMAHAGISFSPEMETLVGSPFTLGVSPELLPSAADVRCIATTGRGPVEFPARLIPMPDMPQGDAWCDVALAASLRFADERPVHYDPDHGALVRTRSGHWAFRLYARDLDSVAPLHQHLTSLGIRAESESARIEEVRVLDAYLTRLFKIIAFVAATGGAAALLASLAATVQRKSRELGILRLLGIPRFTLSFYPVTQGVLLAAGAFMVAYAYFTLFATVIERIFAPQTRPGERFCFLELQDLWPVLGVVITIAAIAALLSGLRILFIEPSEALRDE